MVTMNDGTRMIKAADDLIPVAVRSLSRSGAGGVGTVGSVKEKVEQTGGMAAGGARKLSDAERRAAEATLNQELMHYQPNSVDKTLGATKSATDMFGMGAFFGLPIIGGIGGAIGWVGKKIKLGLLEKTGEKIKAPNNYFKEATFADVGNKLGIGKATGAGADSAAGATGWVAERIPGLKSLSASRAAANEVEVYRHLRSAQAHAGKLTNISNLPEPFQQLHSHVMLAEHPGHIGAVEFMADAASTSQDAVATAQKVTVKKPFSELVTEAEAAFAGAKNLSGAEKSAAKKFLNSTIKMSESAERSGMWKDVPGAIRSVPGKLATTNALHGAVNGAFVLGSGISIVQDGRGAVNRNRMIKEMKADMDAVRAGSGGSAAWDARKSLVKEYAMKSVADAANIYINVKQAISHRFTMKAAFIGMGIAMAAEQVAEMLFADHTAEAYIGFKQLQLAAKAQGAQLSAEHYAGFIAEVSSDLKKRGGTKSRFTQEVAKQYAEEGLSAAQIMVEIQNGKLMARVHNAMDAAEKAKAAQAPEISHAAQVRGDAPARAHKPVVGKHTEDIVAASQTGQQASVVRG